MGTRFVGAPPTAWIGNTSAGVALCGRGALVGGGRAVIFVLLTKARLRQGALLSAVTIRIAQAVRGHASLASTTLTRRTLHVREALEVHASHIVNDRNTDRRLVFAGRRIVARQLGIAAEGLSSDEAVARRVAVVHRTIQLG